MPEDKTQLEKAFEECGAQLDRIADALSRKKEQYLKVYTYADNSFYNLSIMTKYPATIGNRVFGTVYNGSEEHTVEGTLYYNGSTYSVSNNDQYVGEFFNLDPTDDPSEQPNSGWFDGYFRQSFPGYCVLSYV